MNTTRACLPPHKPLIKVSRKHTQVQMRNMSHREAQHAFINGCKLAYPIMISTLIYLNTKHPKKPSRYVRMNAQETDNGGLVEKLTTEKLREHVDATIAESMQTYIPGGDTASKKAWCVKRLTQILETFDNYIPVIGMFMDNPIMDDLEAAAIQKLVDWAWPTENASTSENQGA